MKHRICHITSVHSRYDVRIFQKECISLSNNGYDVCLIVNDNDKDEKREGIKIYSVNEGYRGRLQRIKTVRGIFKKAMEIDAESYHLHDPELLLIAKKLKRKGKKVIFDSHEFYYEQIKTKEYIPQFIRNIIAFMYVKYESNVLKKIDAVVGVKPLLIDGKEVDPFKGKCDRVEYISNYPKRVSRNSALKNKSEFKVCYAGGLTHERGITYLIDACYMAKCKLILAGPFSSEEYHKMLSQKTSYECVDYRGICNRDEIYDIYEESSLGAATLLNVGQYYKMNDFATKVIEYFQMKLPVIISDYPYAVKMNELYGFGICVNPSNCSEIANAIKKMRKSSGLRDKLGENGYMLYEKQLNWESEEKKLIFLYNDMFRRA